MAPDGQERSTTVRVGPERLARWLARFVDQHGEISFRADDTTVVLRAADGTRASCAVPFPPLVVRDDASDGGLTEHARRDRRVGVVLVRKGGYAAGVFDGRTLLDSKVGSRHVQGRSAAGGQSQQRFARRRAKQAREAFQAAADVTARILVPYGADLDAVVTGGDRSAVRSVLEDQRLAQLRALVTEPHLAVPDPKLVVLRGTPDEFRAVRITITELPSGTDE